MPVDSKTPDRALVTIDQGISHQRIFMDPDRCRGLVKAKKEFDTSVTTIYSDLVLVYNNGLGIRHIKFKKKDTKRILEMYYKHIILFKALTLGDIVHVLYPDAGLYRHNHLFTDEARIATNQMREAVKKFTDALKKLGIYDACSKLEPDSYTETFKILSKGATINIYKPCNLKDALDAL